jgi:hypothetical protein
VGARNVWSSCEEMDGMNSPGWTRVELEDGTIYWYSVPRPDNWLPLAVVCERLLEWYDNTTHERGFV